MIFTGTITIAEKHKFPRHKPGTRVVLVKEHFRSAAYGGPVPVGTKGVVSKQLRNQREGETILHLELPCGVRSFYVDNDCYAELTESKDNSAMVA